MLKKSGIIYYVYNKQGFFNGGNIMGIFGFNKASGNILGDLPDRLKNLYREYLDFTKNIDAKYTKAQAENMTNKWCSKKGITVTDGFSGNLI